MLAWPGDFIVLYTDGVFRRGDSIDEGVNAITRLAGAARCCPPGLLEYVDYEAAADDSCVLVAERVR